MKTPTIHTFDQITHIHIIRAECTDLCRDEFGWSANCNWVRRKILVVPATISDSALSRRIKRALGIQGMRPDSWAGSQLSWRDGCVGAWADVE